MQQILCGLELNKSFKQMLRVSCERTKVSIHFIGGIMAAAQQKQTGFCLHARTANDVVRPRPYSGNHKDVVNKAINECSSRSAQILKELAKV
ncbi:hypothetical protein CA267_001700 [Alteromonas pelagimontana]|uniref:Uncharacterized protein n=1 Tax=Alteromonas pelagimontana TaxID=1858656 RepID=A0A6M4M9E8_9ALTE|nr:hypothetical protein [Alteromonas pelagimontana]QJR79599.1 hypothetical protein CA267_001700 [Alteromonas pelagimontana]